MAGIEKVCEFSGDYPGWLMYGYKRNHIQICPQYRKKFRGAKAYIEINKIEKCLVWKTGAYTDYPTWLENDKKPRGRVAKHYFFTLVVEDPELQGEVNGRYYNWTFNMRQTIKRLKRMLRCRDIKVVMKLDEQ